MQQGSARHSLGLLVAEWCGPHVLVRHRDEAASERAFLAQLPATPNELFVSVASGARDVPGLWGDLPTLLRPSVNFSGDVPHSLWLALANAAGQGQPEWISQELGLDVLVPDAMPAGFPGTGAYVGVLPPDLLGNLLRQARDRHQDVLALRGPDSAGLTPREIDVVRLIAEGWDTEEIGNHLCYSRGTVKNIIHAMTSRLNLRNRQQLVGYCLRTGAIWAPRAEHGSSGFPHTDASFF